MDRTELVRGRFSSKWTRCHSPRIINAFGGSKAASFWPPNDNANMRCGGQLNTAPASPDFEQRIMKELATKVAAMVPAVSKHRIELDLNESDIQAIQNMIESQ